MSVTIPNMKEYYKIQNGLMKELNTKISKSENGFKPSSVKNVEIKNQNKVNMQMDLEEIYQKKFERSVQSREKTIYTMGNFNNLFERYENAKRFANIEIAEQNQQIKSPKKAKKLIEVNYHKKFKDEQITGKKFFIKEINKLKKSYLDGFKKAGVSIDKYLVKSMNQAPKNWEKFEKTLKLTSENGEKKEFGSSLTPAKDLGIFDYFDEENISGVSSLDRDTEHAMNLWQTQVKSKNGDILFKALRHGNTRGKESSTKEIILAAAMEQYGVDTLLEIAKAGLVCKVKIANMQLLSPSKIKSRLFDEDMPFKQMDTLKNLSKKIIECKIKEKTLKIKLEEPILFNFGSNLQQFTKGIKFFVSNKESKKRNNEAMVKLFGENLDMTEGIVFDFLNTKNFNKKKDTNKKEKNNQVVKDLSEQIIKIWKSGEYSKNASDPYAIQSRITFLMYKLGYPTSFNCKSGKDRTGMINAEIINLATSIDMNNGKVPKPYQSLKNLQKTNLSKLVNGSGANHVTKACQGVQGLKIVESLGFKGAKKRVGSVQGATQGEKS